MFDERFDAGKGRIGKVIGFCFIEENGKGFLILIGEEV